jgi:hypothetical protein
MILFQVEFVLLMLNGQKESVSFDEALTHLNISSYTKGLRKRTCMNFGKKSINHK